MKYVVVGRVHPERADVRFEPPQVWSTSSGDVLTISCTASQLTVVADLKSDSGHVGAFIHAEQVAQAIVSALGFSLGTGYSVELVQVVTEDGHAHTMGLRPEGLGFEDPAIFARALQLSKQDVFFRLALRDYVRAIGQVLDCGHYCYRAIEAIKSAFQGGWPEMHGALGTTREDIDLWVKDYADPVRHGNWSEFKSSTSDDRFRMLQVTRSVLAKYLDLKAPRFLGETG